MQAKNIEKNNMEIDDMKKLKELRRKAGLTQMQVAQNLSIMQSTVAKWESDDVSYPRAALLPVLADLFHCTIDELYGRSESDS